LSHSLTRRTLLGTAATGAAALAYSGLPAWARPLAQAAGVRRPDSLPFPNKPAGTASMPEIKHVVVLMMENHSFDNLLGMVPHRVPGRSNVDGWTVKHGKITNSNPDGAGHKVFASRATSPCQATNVTQSWDASHLAYDNGHMNGFVVVSGPEAMHYWDETDLPFTYSLAKHFPIGQRYFCSAFGQTYCNRRFFFTGTASGITSTDELSFKVPAANGTIFDRLDQHNVNWKIYYENAPSALIVPGFYNAQRGLKLKLITDFYSDAAAGKLASFTFIDPNYSTTSEEDPQDIQLGERFVSKVVEALMKSPTWKKTALFITYDEHGGYYDHVPPPAAIKPDNIQPLPDPYQPKPLVHAQYNRYGFRVPLIVVSPFARANYVSNVVQDHTSITAFIERKWNLPAMTFRDANAHPMTDYFDFTKAAFAHPPKLAGKPGLGKGLEACHAHGLNPPLTLTGTISD
jgi:phospholipase C